MFTFAFISIFPFLLFMIRFQFQMAGLIRYQFLTHSIPLNHRRKRISDEKKFVDDCCMRLQELLALFSRFFSFRVFSRRRTVSSATSCHQKAIDDREAS